MSWLHLPTSHYSAEPVAATWQANGLRVGAASATSSVTPMPLKSLKPESATDCLTMLPYGMTCQPSTEPPGLALWMESLRAFRANRSAWPESAKPQPMNVMAGLQPFALLEKSNPAGVFWKTLQDFLPGVTATLASYSQSWPKAGLLLDGKCYQRPKWGHRIRGIGSGLWRTPTSEDGGRRGNYSSREKLDIHLANGHTLNLTEQVRWPHLWPTPVHSEARQGFQQRSNGKKGTQISLSTAVKWATPSARDWRSGKASEDTHNRNSRPLSEQIGRQENGGQLNPMWVEWLMGWPPGWTALDVLAMDKFRPWLESHGIYLQGMSND